MALNPEQQDNLRRLLYTNKLDKTYTFEDKFNLAVKLPYDKEERVLGMPAALFDPSTNPMKFFGSTYPLPINVASSVGNLAAVQALTNSMVADGSLRGLVVNSIGTVYNIALAVHETIRTPTVFKQAECAAAPATTDIWTPTNKFRLLGGSVTMSGLIAAAATRTLKLIEETAGTVIFECAVTIPVLGCNMSIDFDFRPNGFKASTAAKKLQVVTSGGTYTTGIDVVSVCGVDEP